MSHPRRPPLPALVWTLAWTLCCLPARAHPPLQLYIALTPAGGTLTPEPGTYSGPVVVDKPLHIDGRGQVTVDGGGSDTVITVTADGVTLRGLRIVNSGDSHDRLDAGVLVAADHVRVEDNVIEDCLFGIHLRGARHAQVRRNRVRSRGREPSLRGEGLRMWNGHHNVVADNVFDGVRDLVIANSSHNRLSGNRVVHSRIGMEFVFSPDNRVTGNRLHDDATGITVLYSNGLRIDHNRIHHMRRLTGSGLAFKESSQVRIEDNEIAHCAVGLRANAPVHPENILYARRNHFLYNDIAMYFYGEKGGHVIHDNDFVGNFTDVLGSAAMTVRDNDWRGNHWDRYAGYDLDGDGYGDQPYVVQLYADRLWRDRPISRFFRGSPALSLVDFVERLAPFSPPEWVLTDPRPRLRRLPSAAGGDG